jgi:hypothetical protein
MGEESQRLVIIFVYITLGSCRIVFIVRLMLRIIFYSLMTDIQKRIIGYYLIFILLRLQRCFLGALIVNSFMKRASNNMPLILNIPFIQ